MFLIVFPFVKGFWTKIAIEHDSFLDVDGRSGVEEWSGVGSGSEANRSELCPKFG